MKIVCEYCGSYVETDEYTKCPNCCAELGSSIRAEEARIARAEQEQREAEEAQRAAEAEQAAQEAKEAHVSEIIQGVASVAAAFVASKAAGDSASTANQTQQAKLDRHMPEPGFAHEPKRMPEPHDGFPKGGNRNFNRIAQAGFNKKSGMPGGHGGHGGPSGGHSRLGGKH